MKKLLIPTFIVVSLLVALVAASCATSTTTTPTMLTTTPNGTAEWEEWNAEFREWETKTYEAAKTEGQVVWYCGEGKLFTQPMTEAFNNTYPGIELVIQTGKGGDFKARITTEQDAGKVLGDLVVTGLSVTRPMTQEGRVQEFIPPAINEPGVKWLDDPLMERVEFPSGPLPLVYGLTSQGCVINTDLVPPDKEPKSWEDFLDPWWKGKIIAQDPRIPGLGNKLWFWMKELHGEEYWEKLAAQDPAIEASYDLGGRAVATGEYYMAIGQNTKALTYIEDAPLKWLLPEDGVPLSPKSAIFVKDAPHPNATKLFYNFIFSKTGQDILGMEGARTPIRADAQLAIPEQSLAGLELLLTTMEQDNVGVAQAREDVKKYIGE